MLTLNELLEVLKIRYTPEELPEALGISADELVDCLQDYVEEHYEEIHNNLEEDGYEESE